jgi:hypothetical protein
MPADRLRMLPSVDSPAPWERFNHRATAAPLLRVTLPAENSGRELIHSHHRVRGGATHPET